MGSITEGHPGNAAEQTHRPGTVAAASLMTWFGALLPIVGGAVLLMARDSLLAMIADLIAGGEQGLVDVGVHPSQAADFLALLREALPYLSPIMTAAGVVSLVWGAVVFLLAVLAFRGSRAAVWGVTVMGIVFVLAISILLLAGELLSLIAASWTGVAVILFHVTSSRQWYLQRQRPQTAGRDGGRYGGAAGGPGGPRGGPHGPATSYGTEPPSSAPFRR
ncbi:hypothetical protein [Pseudactinotalea sp. Z1748]|uniref:hypothetical protein n=1 Tax=Pseudactinotalea sp. Z1748 TaxID=3413027 RepID=UPI003C7B16BA